MANIGGQTVCECTRSAEFEMRKKYSATKLHSISETLPQGDTQHVIQNL